MRAGDYTELEDQRAQLNSTESDTEMFDVKNEHRTQSVISEFEDARTQLTSRVSNTMVIEAEVHAECTDAQHMVHFEEAQDLSDAGSLITQAPQSYMPRLMRSPRGCLLFNHENHGTSQGG